jgi:carbonic anhydrase/acetyltransferase-like protein (isoleucine patch superfamily)
VLEDVVLIGTGAIVLEEVVCRTVSFVAAGALVAPRTEVPSGAMAIGVPARLRLDAVRPDMITGYAGAYRRHLVQHRDGMRLVGVEECTTEDVGP